MKATRAILFTVLACVCAAVLVFIHFRSEQVPRRYDLIAWGKRGGRCFLAAADGARFTIEVYRPWANDQPLAHISGLATRIGPVPAYSVPGRTHVERFWPLLYVCGHRDVEVWPSGKVDLHHPEFLRPVMPSGTTKPMQYRSWAIRYHAARPLLCGILVLWLIWACWVAWRGSHRLVQRRKGKCRRCGYDLRATPQRCPECGMSAL